MPIVTARPSESYLKDLTLRLRHLPLTYDQVGTTSGPKLPHGYVHDRVSIELGRDGNIWFCQPGLLQGAPQGTGRDLLAWFASDGHAAGLDGMPVLAVAASLANQPPAVTFEHLDQFRERRASLNLAVAGQSTRRLAWASPCSPEFQARRVSTAV